MKMENFETKFIQETIEEKPFRDFTAQNFFKYWCAVNDDLIIPKFVSRKEWEEKKPDKILKKFNSSEKKILLVPEKLQLWEMIDIIEEVDKDTFRHKPELSEKKSKELKELSQMFQKSGIYFAQYLKDIDKGKEIAQEMSHRFYEYGISLEQRKFQQIPFKNIKKQRLSEDDKRKVDEWLLGPSVFEKRIKILRKKYGINIPSSAFEEQRKKLLNTYFNILSRETLEKKDLEKPWQTKTGPFRRLQEKTKEQIIATIKKPEGELIGAIMRRGLEKLVNEIKDSRRVALNRLSEYMRSNLRTEEKKLIEALEIPKLKQELERVRQTKNIEKIVEKEKQITAIIQNAINEFPREKDQWGPSTIAKTLSLNCLGALILGGELLNRVKIKHLKADIPGHTVILLITSDKRIYWRDMLKPSDNKEITDKDMEKNTIKDIINFLENPTKKSLNIDMKPDWYRQNITTPKGFKPFLEIHEPKIGQESELLFSAGAFLIEKGYYHEAIKAFHQLKIINSEHTYADYGLGYALYCTHHYQEAVKFLRQAIIRTKSRNSHIFYILGKSLKELGQNKEAIKVFQEFIQLGGKEEDIIEAQKYITQLKEEK